MEIIKLTDKDMKYLKDTIESNQDAQVAFNQASYLLRTTNDEIWSTIHKLFPEKKIKKGKLSLKEKEIIILDE